MSPLSAFALFLALVGVAVLLLRRAPRPKASDRALTSAINLALSREFPMGRAAIDVKTFNGVVILGGFVREQDQRLRALEIARKAGAASVDDRITIRPE
jgi:osmotically-inducible protein OsmY